MIIIGKNFSQSLIITLLLCLSFNVSQAHLVDSVSLKPKIPIKVKKEIIKSQPYFSEDFAHKLLGDSIIINSSSIEFNNNDESSFIKFELNTSFISMLHVLTHRFGSNYMKNKNLIVWIDSGIEVALFQNNQNVFLTFRKLDY